MPTQYKKKKTLPWAFSNAGTGCPEKLWDLYPWRYLRCDRPMPSAACSNWTCLEPGAGPQDLYRSPPSHTTLGLQVCSVHKPEEQDSKTPLFRKHHTLINAFGLEWKCQEEHSVCFQNLGLNIQMKKHPSWHALRCTQYCLSGNQTRPKFSSTKKVSN